MKNLVDYFGCGRYVASDNYGDFLVTKFKDLVDIIIPFFDKYPIIGMKALDFAD